MLISSVGGIDMKAKNQLLRVSLIWILLYVIAMSAAETFSDELGIYSSVTLPVTIIFAIVLYVFVKKKNLSEEIGLCPNAKLAYSNVWYCVPFIIIATVNLWNGVTLRFSVNETVFHIVSMLMVGFIEEVLFRGLLYTAISRKNVRLAIIISSLTFGAGHVVNMAIGADAFSTVLQMIYAVAIGFAFSCFVQYSKHLWPCIICHGVLNALSVFSVEGQTIQYQIIVCLILTVISVGYGIILLKQDKQA